ncbi:MAG: PilC/PilY family type IV pilus protein, partial [Gammaproteobacteria bacterium]
MAWAYVPDTMGGNRYTDRYKSSTFNALYYNPNVTYDAPVDASGNTYSTSFTCAYIDGFDTSLGCIDLSSDYAAPVSYTPGSSYQWVVYANGYYSRQWPTYNAYSTSDAYYYVYDSSCTLSGGTNNDGCYTRVDVSSTSGPGGTDERQNFANWYSFYRTRNLSVVSGSSLAFAQLNDQTRVAWQVLNRCRAFGSSQRCGWNNSYYDNQLGRFTGTHKDNFYSWLSRLPASGGTPLRAALARAGAMYETSRPYEYDPGVTSTPTYACRQNYSIIMTDGIWNGSVTSYGNQDGSDHTLPDGVDYSPVAPYKDSNSTSLADIAFYYWRTDLRSTLSDSGELKYEPVTTAETVTSGGTSQTIQPYWNPKNDPASWQHMVTFTVGVGLGSWLTSPQWGGDTYAAPAYDAFASGASNWPTTGSDAAPENVYDLYHAAIDSRGQFFSAENPNDIVTAFKTIIQRIQNRTGSSSSASFSTGRLLASSQAFLATFDSADWSGDLAARPISDGTGNLTCTPTSLYPRGAFCPPAWHAQTVLNTQNWDPTSTDANRRQIITTAGGVGVPFTWSNLSSTEQTALEDGGTATDGQNRLDWLRGDRAQEVKSGGSYRNRSYVLGDIVNSSPVYQPAPDFDYDYYTSSSTFKWQDVLYGTTGPETDYATFQSAHKTRLNLVWVGSNDGFLHAFKAGHYDSSGTFQNSDNNGQEQFAFMPKVAMQNAATLTDPNYRTAGLHHYFVDGQMEITDAFFKKPADSAAAWHSVLVGGMGAGGQEIYALDVTNPSQLTEANAASTVMWEFTDADDADLGDTYGKPHIVRLHNDEWGVLVNNGFGNTIADSHVGSGHAVLYVLDLAT